MYMLLKSVTIANVVSFIDMIGAKLGLVLNGKGKWE